MVLKKKRRRKKERVIGENGELPRKCRARYGLHQINLWCKPCRYTVFSFSEFIDNKGYLILNFTIDERRNVLDSQMLMIQITEWDKMVMVVQLSIQLPGNQ